ncbi:sensor histidine kinase [Parabacteroides sp. AM08-6]|uniref:sensor histidine kinase n=1 Tax=Parabacteroides sp. AM08-6 TaxID=2292053 RepID=UPI000EFE8F15|nr:histidine kinase [Parabacteroides sp. AM08-6]RHJ83458.1 histidine kinase [Parabacteroides sp. AM08-6]
MEKQEYRQQILENLIYAVIWLVVLSMPLWDSYTIGNSIGTNWQEAFHFWRIMLPFFLLFLINNYLLIPYLLIRKRSWLYLLFIFLSIIVTLVANMDKVPNPRKQNNRPPWEQIQSDKYSNIHHPPMIRQPLFMPHLLTIILIIGINLAIKLLFKSIRDEHRMKELEKHTLQTELEYLKHQINPHFFMNTLNNIHALIDINSERAKNTVLELSKLMRYILYDASLPSVPLEKEIRFLNNYIGLMKIRFTDKVDICMSLPNEIPDVQIPPLLFISFLENAFKHGISYCNPSFIHLSMEIKLKELHCLLVNSNYKNKTERHKGIGLENIKKRLRLLYNENYTLHIENKENEYQVLLIIPIQS